MRRREQGHAMTVDRPPPFPVDAPEATAFVDVDELAPADHVMEPERTSTNTRFGMPAARDDIAAVPGQEARQRAADARRREPAPAPRRPTLFGDALAGAKAGPRTVRPGVLDPVRPRTDSSKPDISVQGGESSDVISTFSADGSGPPAPARVRPRLERRPPRPAGSPNFAKTSPPPAIHPASTPVLATLPLDHEQLLAMISDQRRRLGILFAWARGLEIGAGILGTMSLAVLVTALVGSLLSQGPALLPGAAALIGAATGAGLSLTMLVAAVALRQLGHLSAQQAALLEALCTARQHYTR